MFDNANFEGVTNINIEIKGAFHNDFAYNPNQYADRTLWTQTDMAREKINRQTNLFMRRLYQSALSDQTNPGDLQSFLNSLVVDGSAELVNGKWVIDPLKLDLLAQ